MGTHMNESLPSASKTPSSLTLMITQLQMHTNMFGVTGGGPRTPLRTPG